MSSKNSREKKLRLKTFFLNYILNVQISTFEYSIFSRFRKVAFWKCAGTFPSEGTLFLAHRTYVFSLCLFRLRCLEAAFSKLYFLDSKLFFGFQLRELTPQCPTDLSILGNEPRYWSIEPYWPLIPRQYTFQAWFPVSKLLSS